MYGNDDRGRSGGGRSFGGGGRSFGGGDRFAPVKVGDEMTVKIEALGEKGDGIAKKDGFVIFVPGVRQGDEVKIKVNKVLKKVGFAEVVGKGSADSSSKETEEDAEDEEEISEDNKKNDSDDFGEDDDFDDNDDASDEENPEDSEDEESDKGDYVDDDEEKSK